MKKDLLAVVVEVTEQKDLIVELENGRHGFIPFEEIGRRRLDPNRNMDWMRGRSMRVLVSDDMREGMHVCSGMAYEEGIFNEIETAFHEKRRNVFTGELVSVTDTAAYYRLAQGVNGIVNISDFAFARIPEGFKSVLLPQHATLVIKSIQNGTIFLSQKPSWGDFEYSVNRLRLREGCELKGVVCSRTNNPRFAIAMVAPNLTFLCKDVEIGETVVAKITGIDMAARRIRNQMISHSFMPTLPFDYEGWMLQPEDLGAWFDLEAFEGRIRPELVASGNDYACRKDAPISFELPDQKVSPFAIREGEKSEHCFHPASTRALFFELQQGLLTQDHKLVCEAVNELRYTNAFLLQRYLSIKHGVNFAADDLKKLLKRLEKHNILGMLRFKTPCGETSTPVYHVGYNYKAYMGTFGRLQTWEYTSDDASVGKNRLAANQLLLGMLNSCSCTNHDPHPYILKNEGSEDEVRVRPYHALVCDDRTCYIESIRTGSDFDAFAKKLGAYQRVIDITGEKAEVLVAVETPELAQEYALRAKDISLNFPVRFCADGEALPAPKFHTAEPNMAAKTGEPSTPVKLSFFRKVLNALDRKAS